jgi:signal peptidase I
LNGILTKLGVAIFLLLSVACTEGQRAVFSGLKAARVPSGGMDPTINVNDYVFSETYGESETPKRFDVIVFKYPVKPDVKFVKRAIGLPGETVEIRRKAVYINGSLLADPHGHHTDERTYDDRSLPEPYRSRDNFGPFRLGNDQFFALGDNRDASSDSRYWGPVPRKLIESKVRKVGPPAGPLREIE